jgi:diguanylate cyclase
LDPVERRTWRGDRSVGRATDRVARLTLRALVSTSTRTGVLVIVAGLAASWAVTYLAGGADRTVPHWYYLPIVLAAARFGHLAALAVAVLAGFLAGPLTLVSVAEGVTQDPSRWLTRMGFFVVIGQVVAGIAGPVLPPVGEELRRLREERGLRRGLHQGEFFVVYQPIVDLRSGRMAAVEALVRWQHPEEGQLAPASFLPAAERSEVINDLGAFVLDEACRQAAEWSHIVKDGRPLRMNVNLSRRELEAPDLVNRVRASLERSGLAPDRLCLEITESVFVDDLEACVRQLSALKELGVTLAVDDFGSGYSSMSAVHAFPIDILKVDRSFVAQMGRDGQAEAVCGGLVLFARTLELTTVAEGVETAGQLDAVRECGYDLAQGYFYATPQPAREVTYLLEATHGQLAPSMPSGNGRRQPR